MSIEEKSRAYDEALERAKSFQEKYGGGYAEYIFPELSESEDERIRKVIHNLLLGMREEIFTSQDEIVTKEKALAYLEKHKPVEWRPSDEQIKAMGYFVRKHQATANHATTTWPEFEAFKSLYQDLKKL